MILVTGGAGFIGSNFVLDWIEAESEPVAEPGQAHLRGQHGEPRRRSPDNARHVFVKGDIADAALVQRLFAEHKPRAVVHFAAESHVDRSIDGPAAFVQTNVVGTFELLEAARAYWSALAGRARDASASFTSPPTRCTARSAPRSRPSRETTPYAPNSPLLGIEGGIGPPGARLPRTPTACRCSPPTARTTTARTSSRRSSSRS